MIVLMGNHLIDKVLEQVFIKTLRFGTVTLYKIPDESTIDNLLKQARLKIDRKFEGYDIEMLLLQEHALMFDGLPMEGGRSIAP